MIFNVLLSIPYILIGSFGPLVTFVGIFFPSFSTASSSSSSFLLSNISPQLPSTPLTLHLTIFPGIAVFIFLFLTVLGSLILRIRQPALHRPYKPSILIPALFCIISFLLVLRGVIFAPVQSAILAVVIAAGGVIGFLKRGR